MEHKSSHTIEGMRHDPLRPDFHASHESFLGPGNTPPVTKGVIQFEDSHRTPPIASIHGQKDGTVYRGHDDVPEDDWIDRAVKEIEKSRAKKELENDHNPKMEVVGECPHCYGMLEVRKTWEPVESITMHTPTGLREHHWVISLPYCNTCGIQFVAVPDLLLVIRVRAARLRQSMGSIDSEEHPGHTGD